MGTNYYVEAEPPCEHCGRGGEELHIGKSSAGWAFCFAPYPERGLTTWAAWRKFLASSSAAVRDEYGTDITLGELVRCVEVRGDGQRRDARYHTIDGEGYVFSQTADFT